MFSLLKRIMVIGVIAILLSVSAIFSSCSNGSVTEQSTLHISPAMCEFMLEGLSPNDFCASKGKNTFLENKYLHAYVDKDGCLILTLEENIISEWKNSFTALQVLQCVLGDTRDIGVTVDYSKDFMDYMKDADTCGYEISEDFTKVIESPEDNSWYFPFTATACALMQIFNGKTCTELKVEHIEIDEKGEILETVIFPEETDIP